MLQIVRASTFAGLAPGDWPPSAAGRATDCLQRLLNRPENCDWIVPSDARRRSLLRRLRSQSLSGLPFFGLRTLDEWLADAANRAGAEASPQGPEKALRQLIESSGSLRRLFRHTELVFVDGLSCLSDDVLELFAAVSDVCPVLVWLVASPGQPGWNLAQRISRRLEDYADAVEVIDHFTPPRSALAGLGRRLFSGISKRPCPEGLFQLVAPSPRAQIEAVAARIKTDLRQSDVTPDQIAVVSLSDADVELVRQVFHEAGVPLALPATELPLLAARPTRVLRLALEIERQNWKAGPFLDFLSHPAVQRTLVNPHALPRLFLRSPARPPSSAGEWLGLWNGLLLERPDDTALRPLVDSIQPLLQLLDTLHEASTVSSLASSCLALLDLLQIAGWLEATASPALETERRRDRQAWEKLYQILRRLVHADDDEPTPTLPAILGNIRYRVEPDDRPAVHLLCLQDVPGASFRHIYVIGLSDQPDKIAQRLPQSTPVTEHDLITSIAFGQLFEAADERLVLCRPEHDRDQIVRPHSLLSTVEEAVQMPPMEPAAYVVLSLSQAQRQLGALARTQSALPTQWLAEPVKQVWNDLTVWRARPGWPNQVAVDDPRLLQALFPEERAFNPAELESYAACPFRFLSQKLLPRDAASSAPRLRYYHLLRRVVADFHRELRELRNVPAGKPLPPPGPEDLPLLKRLFEQAWTELEEGGLPPELRTLATCDEGVLDWFVRGLAEIDAGPERFGNLLHDLEFPTPDGEPIFLGHDRQGRPVMLTGSIERLDVGRGGRPEARLIRYRLGKALTPAEQQAKTADGRLLQLPLQAVALRQLRPDLRPVAGVQLHLSERARTLKQTVSVAGELGELGLDAAAAKALELAGELRAGLFPLSAHGPDAAYPECTSLCPQRHVCRRPDGFVGGS